MKAKDLAELTQDELMAKYRGFKDELMQLRFQHATGQLEKTHRITEVRRGAEAAALLKAGAVDGLSIGYRAIRSEKTPGGGRRLIEVDLWEVSLVTFPMLPEARALSGAKTDALAGQAEDEAARALAEALREARGVFS